MLLDSVLSGGLSGLLMATFLLYADVVEREKKSLMSPLVRALIPFTGPPPCVLITSQRPHLPETQRSGRGPGLPLGIWEGREHSVTPWQTPVCCVYKMLVPAIHVESRVFS